jgi:hypothetical protein
MLTLGEELFLLCVDEESGIVIPRLKRQLRYGLAGAVLVELALQGKVRVDQKGRLELLNAEPAGDELLDQALEKLSESKRERKLNAWIDSLAAKSNKLCKRTEKQLESCGVIQRQNGRVEWVVPSPDRSEEQVPAKYGIKSRLREQILSGAEPDLRSLALLDLLRACNLLKLVFTKDERKAARQCIYERMVGEGLRDNTAQEIADITQTVNNMAGG